MEVQVLGWMSGHWKVVWAPSGEVWVLGWTSGSWNGGLEYCVSLDLINAVDAGLVVLAPGWTSEPLNEGLGLGCSSDLQMKICVLGGCFRPWSVVWVLEGSLAGWVDFRVTLEFGI